jgi:hypothetical protein
MDKKLGVIVPFRHRGEHLYFFLKEIVKYLNEEKIPHEIIIVNQDDGKQFNRGMLLNIGFKCARNLRCDYVVFHDVDLLPLDVDYSYCDHPVHLATLIEDEDSGERSKPFDEYFGGVTMFPIKDFKKINGYSNKYWGWGFEDDDLFLRCKNKSIGTEPYYIKKTRNFHKSLKFNGQDSFVRAKNNFCIDKDLTLFASFFPDELVYDSTKDLDVYTVFSIPGYDTAISYNSFKRYNFVTFNSEEKASYINTEITTNYQTNICITLNQSLREINFYQDGEHIGKTNWEGELKDYSDEKYFFIGAGNPKRNGDPNFFKGYIDSLVVLEGILSENEVKSVSATNDFSEYKKSGSILCHYDAEHIENYKLVDLSGNGNDASIFKCEIVDMEGPWFKKIDLPIRRDSIFKSMKHEQNGFFENRWKDKATRWNQLRFYNEVRNNSNLLFGDGLSDLKYTDHGRKREGNITEINVGI